MARRAMVEAGFAVDVPPQVERDLRGVTGDDAPPGEPIRDLRALLWSSIDNPESRDLDQLEYARPEADDAIRLLIAIADVDAHAPKGSATDQLAFQNCTSVYTGVDTFPMLPAVLSEDITSLLENDDRLAVVVEILVSKDGTLADGSVYRARVRNQARMNYEDVSAWLADNRAPFPSDFADHAAMGEQLRLQREATRRLRDLRFRRGALDFETIEASPVTGPNGQVTGLAVTPKSEARYLIEDVMLAVNGAVVDLLEERGVASIQRVVRTPKRWDRIVEIAARLNDPLPQEPSSRALADFLARRRTADPVHFPDLSLSVVKLLGAGEYTVIRAGGEAEEHFGLAVQGYTHSTAPNRRYADLAIQRLIKSVIVNAPAPYSLEELEAIAARCTERTAAAQKVERKLRKAAAAVFLRPRIGETFNAIVTGASNKGTYVRLLSPPAEGRVVQNEDGLDVGDTVRVRLLNTNPENGFIDFAAL